MKKLQSDLRRAQRKYDHCKQEYEKAREELERLVTLEEVERLDALGVRPELHRVSIYGAFLGGVRKALCKILNDCFLDKESSGLKSADDRLTFKAMLQLATQSPLSADRWIGEDMNMMFEPVRDKKGRVTEYRACWYVERTVRQKI